MEHKTRSCPKCSGTMTFRLGEFVCGQCDYFEAAQPRPEQERKVSGPGLKKDSQWRAPPAKAPGTPGPRVGMRLREPVAANDSLSREKVAFLTIFFALQLVSSFIISVKYSGIGEAALSLPGLLIASVFYTLGAGFALYFDNDGVRQCCLWTLAPIVLVGAVSIYMAFGTGQGAVALTLIPNVAISGWLVTILLRDTRSG